DAARILAKSHDELKPTDITQHSLDKLIHSRIKDVHIVGRRSAVQASFTHQEIAELQKLQDCDVVVDPVDMELDENGRQELEADERIQNRRFWSIFEAFSRERKQGMNRRLIFRFLRSPVAFEGDGKVERVVFQKNRLEGEPGRRKARGTGETEVVEAGLVITCVGYRGAPIPGVPFHDAWGVVPNEQGRVMENDRAVPGLYVSGWIKRGPSGVIGTNKACSVETVTSLLADLDRLTPCEKRNSDDLRQDLLRRGLNVIDFIDWKKIDAEEVSRGEAVGKPREKMVLVDEMLSVAGGS
ncbi:MAG: NADP oxidoreductase, partial [Verrucomicrobiota bacterium]